MVQIKRTLKEQKSLVDNGCDLIVIDTAHGHSEKVLKTLSRLKKIGKSIPICVGNIATGEAAKKLYNSGANIIKVGIGPGSICTTRMVAGIGVPQISAIMEVKEALKNKKIKMISDGGVKFSGDIAKALAAGADAIMMGSIFAGTDESPGKKFMFKGKIFKHYRGMGSIGAMSSGSANRYFQKNFKDKSKFVPEGVEGRVEYKENVSKIIYQLKGGLRSSMGYIGAKNLKQISKNAKFIKITKAGFYESMVHSVEMTQKQLTTNYDKQFIQMDLNNYDFSNTSFANTEYFNEGLNLFKKKKYEEAKFKFEQDIVFNPKSEMSYLYLSKIYKNLKKIKLEEQNLKTVILLNPTNEEAIYNLAKLKLDSSDYKKSKELNDNLINFCNKFCDKSYKLKTEIENLLKNKCNPKILRKKY